MKYVGDEMFVFLVEELIWNGVVGLGAVATVSDFSCL